MVKIEVAEKILEPHSSKKMGRLRKKWTDEDERDTRQLEIRNRNRKSQGRKEWRIIDLSHRVIN